jgi:glycosyltransferase involved in cell wall biosynthesis
VIPTYNNYELLRTRALPSVLGQSYQNFEIVVVGDAAPLDAKKAVEGVGDPRISFFNLPYRGPYPSDPAARWFVVGTPPFNEGTHRASGRWIAPLDDDDAFAPNHLERLLERARADRLELAYGQIDMHLPDGRTERRGSFPPQYGQFNLQAAIWHAGLSAIFQGDLADAALGVANDWALLVRMMEAGVRVGFLEEVVVDYFPARSAGSSEGYWGSPSASET